MLQFERDALTARGMSVRLARSAREGIEILKHESVDAVVTDVKMPGEVSTVRLYRWIEQNQAELAGRVTFTVSPGCETELKGTLRKSSCQFLRKPFEEVKLWEAVQKMLSVGAPTPARR